MSYVSEQLCLLSVLLFLFDVTNTQLSQLIGGSIYFASQFEETQSTIGKGTVARVDYDCAATACHMSQSESRAFNLSRL